MRIYRIDREEEAIAEVQRYLRAASYRYEQVPHIGIDGIYGKETREAVRAFQATASLEETRVVDALTFSRLYEESLKKTERNTL